MNIVLVGGGGHCMACHEVVATSGRQVLGVLDPRGVSPRDDLPWLGDDAWAETAAASEVEFLVTVGQVAAGGARRALYDRLVGLRRGLATVRSPHAWVAEDAILGRGTIVMHRAVVGPRARVGDNCIVNTGAIIEHGAMVESHVHVATGAIVNGDAHVGEGTLIGSGAVVAQGVRIAPGSTIGAGAVVVRDIDEAGVWIGVPARRMQ